MDISRVVIVVLAIIVLDLLLTLSIGRFFGSVKEKERWLHITGKRGKR